MSDKIEKGMILTLKLMNKYIKVLLLLWGILVVLTLVDTILRILCDTFALKLLISEILECVGLCCIVGVKSFIDACIFELEKGSR
jgi:hypothetical protein